MTFGQSVMLLLLTAALTGLLVPGIKEFIDRRSLRKQQIFEAERRKEEKDYEADLARQNKVIESQAELLDSLAGMLWKLWKMILRVIYYRTLHKSPDKHEQAFREYDEQTWDLMTDIRVEMSRARRLSSPQVHERLVGLYDKLVNVDIAMLKLRDLDAERQQADNDELWDEFRIYVYAKVGHDVDLALTDLARELRLAETGASEE